MCTSAYFRFYTLISRKFANEELPPLSNDRFIYILWSDYNMKRYEQFLFVLVTAYRLILHNVAVIKRCNCVDYDNCNNKPVYMLWYWENSVLTL